jgi:hypothetical protein
MKPGAAPMGPPGSPPVDPWGRVRRIRYAHGEPANRWLAPARLLTTAKGVVMARVFADFADKRELMASVPREYYTIMPPDERQPVRVDYVSDTGDGFDATFAVARIVADTPGVSYLPDPSTPPAGRADLLLFGGDQVYPAAGTAGYSRRLNSVFELARLRAGAVEDGSLPPVVALPGNHDWYDGLVAFRRNFCESWAQRDLTEAGTEVAVRLGDRLGFRNRVGGWGAIQSRSYFAVRVRPGWWVWGLDSQLDKPVDAEQLSYFREAMKLVDDDNIVLCTATPSWLEAAGRQAPDFARGETPLRTMLGFVERVLGEKHRHQLRLVITGDKHHYVRYVPQLRDDQGYAPPLVTCGGGGAFTSSTHHLPPRLTIPWRPRVGGDDAVRYHFATDASGVDVRYPSERTSRAMRRRLPSLLWRNGLFPGLIGLIDLALLGTVVGTGSWWSVPSLTVGAVLGLLAGAYALTGIRGRHEGWFGFLRSTGAAIWHTVLHLGVIWLVWKALGAIGPPSGEGWGRFAFLAAIWTSAYLALAVLGTLCVAVYLFVADVFGYHMTEASSAIRATDCKAVLRMRFDDDGLRVWAVGIDQVPAVRRLADPLVAFSARVVDSFHVAPHT